MKKDFYIKLDISLFRIFIRIFTLVFLISSLFIKEWFCLTKLKESIMIKIGVFKYCNEDECFPYRENFSKYFIKLLLFKLF